MKTMTLRLSQDLAHQVEMVAWVERKPQAVVICEAIDRYLQDRRAK